MTRRTEYEYHPAPIEKATHEVITALSAAIEDAHRNHKLTMSLPIFRRVVALYLSRQDDTAMCQMLGATPPEERKDSIGE
jgi:hypothetical protein